MIKNKLFLILLCVTTCVFTMDQSNKPLEVMVTCKAIKQLFEVAHETAKENELKCCSFGIKWIEPHMKVAGKVVQIQPMYKNEAGATINGLFQPSRELNKAIFSQTGLSSLEKFEKAAKPQFPKYIPFDAVYGEGIGNTSIWNFQGIPITVQFKDKNQLIKITESKPSLKERFISTTQDISFDPVVWLDSFSTQVLDMLFFIYNLD